jgi:hypothetical protein
MNNNQLILRNLNDLNLKVKNIENKILNSNDNVSLNNINENNLLNENKKLKNELELIKKNFEQKFINIEKELNNNKNLQQKIINIEKELNNNKNLQQKIINIEKELNNIKTNKNNENIELKIKNIENELKLKTNNNENKNNIEINKNNNNEDIELKIKNIENELNKLKPNVPAPNQFVNLQKEFNQLKPHIPGPNQFINLQKEFNQFKPNILKIPELEKKLLNSPNDPTLRKDINELKEKQKEVSDIDNIIKENFTTTNVKFEEVNKAVLSLDENLKDFNKIKADIEDLKNKIK